MFPVNLVDISNEKANEYMQVASLLSTDVELLHDITKDEDLTKEELVAQIALLYKNMVDMTTNTASRQSRWGAFTALWGSMGAFPDTGIDPEDASVRS